MREKIFLKRVLIPLWVIQILVLLVFAGAAGVVLYAVEKVNPDDSVESVLKYVPVRQKATSSLLN